MLALPFIQCRHFHSIGKMAAYKFHQLQSTAGHGNNRLSYAIIAGLVIFMIVNISTKGGGTSSSYVHSSGRFSNPDEASNLTLCPISNN